MDNSEGTFLGQMQPCGDMEIECDISYEYCNNGFVTPQCSRCSGICAENIIGNIEENHQDCYARCPVYMERRRYVKFGPDLNQPSLMTSPSSSALYTEADTDPSRTVIVLGVCLAVSCVVIIILLILLYNRWKQRRKTKSHQTTDDEKILSIVIPNHDGDVTVPFIQERQNSESGPAPGSDPASSPAGCVPVPSNAHYTRDVEVPSNHHTSMTDRRSSGHPLPEVSGIHEISHQFIQEETSPKCVDHTPPISRRSCAESANSTNYDLQSDMNSYATGIACSPESAECGITSVHQPSERRRSPRVHDDALVSTRVHDDALVRPSAYRSNSLRETVNTFPPNEDRKFRDSGVPSSAENVNC